MEQSSFDQVGKPSSSPLIKKMEEKMARLSIHETPVSLKKTSTESFTVDSDFITPLTNGQKRLASSPAIPLAMNFSPGYFPDKQFSKSEFRSSKKAATIRRVSGDFFSSLRRNKVERTENEIVKECDIMEELQLLDLDDILQNSGDEEIKTSKSAYKSVFSDLWIVPLERFALFMEDNEIEKCLLVNKSWQKAWSKESIWKIIYARRAFRNHSIVLGRNSCALSWKYLLQNRLTRNIDQLIRPIPCRSYIDLSPSPERLKRFPLVFSPSSFDEIFLLHGKNGSSRIIASFEILPSFFWVIFESTINGELLSTGIFTDASGKVLPSSSTSGFTFLDVYISQISKEFRQQVPLPCMLALLVTSKTFPKEFNPSQVLDNLKDYKLDFRPSSLCLLRIVLSETFPPQPQGITYLSTLPPSASSPEPPSLSKQLSRLMVGPTPALGQENRGPPPPPRLNRGTLILSLHRRPPPTHSSPLEWRIQELPPPSFWDGLME